MRGTLAWLLTVVITLASAVFQRMTGPTYPLRGTVEVAGETVTYRLPRSADVTGDAEIVVPVAAAGVEGHLEYKRLGADDAWTLVPMVRRGEALAAALPRQPAAGKLIYRAALRYERLEVPLADGEPAALRFKGPVPAGTLLPHVLIMFAAMLFSTRAGLAALDGKSNPRRLALWAAGLLFAGGLIFGPLVQKAAFGVYWSGLPFGFDLTDNKTLLSIVAWGLALYMGRRGRPARGWIVAAAVVTLAVYLIPHSLLGSELDYSRLN